MQSLQLGLHMSSEVSETPGELSEDAGQGQLDFEVKAMYGGAAISVIGAFLPWYTLLGQSVLGIEGDGILTLVLGVLAIGLIWHFDSEKRQLYTGIGAGVLISIIALYHLTNISGGGVYLTLLGGIVLLGGGLKGYTEL